MIDYIDRSSRMTIECDTCGETDEFGGDFTGCIDDAKRAGWFVVSKFDQYHHYCSEECRGESK